MNSKVQDLITKNINYLALTTSNLKPLLNICIEKYILPQNEAEEIREAACSYYDRNTKFYCAIQKTITDVDALYEIFLLSGNKHLIKKLDLNGTENCKEYDTPIWHEVPPVGKNFVGRKDELEIIRKEYEDSLKDNRLALIAVTGLGGIGKSELIKYFAKEFLNQRKGHCIWLNAENSNIRDSVQRFAKSINIPLESPNKNEKPLHKLTSEISEHPRIKDNKCLFVFDNIENFEEVITDIIDKFKSRHPHEEKPLIILTSRDTKFTNTLGLDVTSVHLDCLTLEQAATFVKNSLEIKGCSDQINIKIQKLCEQLHCYPLALTQAASYIRKSNGNKDGMFNNISEYINLLEEDKPQALSFPSAGKEKNTICKSLGITLKQLKKPTHEVMDCISFLHCEKIHIQMVSSILSKPEEEVNKAFESLCDYSVCTKTIEEKLPDYFSIHPMVQEVHNCTMSNRKDSLEATVAVIFKKLGQNQEEFVTDMMHLEAIWNHVARNGELKLKYISLPSKIARAYYNIMGNYRHGYEFSSKVAKDLAECRNLDASFNTYYLKMLYWQGNFLQKTGDFGEALKVLIDVLKLQLNNSRENDMDIFWTHYSIGVVEIRQAKLKEAMARFQLVHKIIEGDEKYKDLLREIDNERATVLFYQCKYLPSLELYENTLKSKIKYLEKEHHSVLKTKHWIGMVKFYQGNYEEALNIFKEVAEVAERKKLGPDGVQAQCWESRCLRLLKRYPEALALANTVLKRKEEIFGKKHVNVLGTRQNIATILFDEGKFQEALVRYNKILKDEEKVLDSKYPLLLLTKHSKAATLRALGQYDEALTLVNEVLAIRKHLYEDDHVDVLASEHEKATIKSHLGKYNSAWRLYGKVLVGRKEIVGDNHPDTIQTQIEFNLVTKLRKTETFVRQQTC